MKNNAVRYFVPLIMACAAFPAGASTVLSVSPSSTVAQVGDVVTVAIQLSNVSDLYAWEFDLSYDDTVLDPTSGGVEGSFLPGGGGTFFLAGDTSTPGEIDLTSDSLLSAGPGVTGSGDLVDFSFTAISLGTSALTIVPNGDYYLLNSSLDAISATITNGSVLVSSPEPSTWLLIILGGSASIVFGPLPGKLRLVRRRIKGAAIV